jgi:hypothetical protein
MEPNTEKELLQLLEQLRRQLTNGTIHFEGRKKNQQALLDLEITPTERKAYLLGMVKENYYSGPHLDEVHAGCRYWEFGIDVKGIEVYVKITHKNAATDIFCISFHRAEYTMDYPLKK